jgi:hypothetical protein
LGIHLFIPQIFLSAYNMPTTVLRRRDLSVSQSDKNPRSHRADILLGGSWGRKNKISGELKRHYTSPCLEHNVTSAYLLPDKAK